jgi:hypothetical protein
MREARVRSELADDGASTGGGAGVSVEGTFAFRSCALRASSAETTTGPEGTVPASAAGCLPAFSGVARRGAGRRSNRRFGGRSRTCGVGWLASFSSGGAVGAAVSGVGVSLTKGIVSCLLGCVRFFAAAVCFAAWGFEAFLRAAAGAFFVVGTLRAVLKSVGAPARKSRARWRRAISASISAMISFQDIANSFYSC